MKARFPSISVVIPTYNYARFLPAALDSVLAHRHAPLEIIVVDDGLTDETPEVLHRYGAKIRYIRQKNAGVSAARNAGIRAARGGWVALLDSDDAWHPDKLLLQMRCAEQHPEVCVIGALSLQARRAAPKGELFTLLGTRDLLGSSVLTSSSVAVRREALLRAGLFDVTRRWAEDREMWLKLSLLGKAARVNVPLWDYRPHDQQAHSDHVRCSENYRRMLDDFFALHPEQSGHRGFAYAYFHYDAALSYHAAGYRFKPLAHLVQSFLLHPGPLKQPYAEKPAMRSAFLLKAVLGARAYGHLVSIGKKAFPAKKPAVPEKKTLHGA